MDFLVTEVVERFYAFMAPMIRISAFLLAAPFFFNSSGVSKDKSFACFRAHLDDLSSCRMASVGSNFC
jgi:flagellar biosynthesis protein FliR